MITRQYHGIIDWLSGVAVVCQRCHASNRGLFPRSASGRKSWPATVPCEGRTTGGLGQLGLPGCDEALSGMGGASLTREVQGASKRRFSSEVGYATLPRFPQCEHSPSQSKLKNSSQVQWKKKVPIRKHNEAISVSSHEVAINVKEMQFRPIIVVIIVIIF